MTSEHNMPSITQDGHEWIRVVDHLALVEKAVEAERERIRECVEKMIDDKEFVKEVAVPSTQQEVNLVFANQGGIDSLYDVLQALTPTKTDQQTEV